MACAPKCAPQINLVRSLGTAFQANCLGNQTQPRKPHRLVPDVGPPPCCSDAPCRIKDGSAFPLQYEAGEAEGFMAYTTPPQSVFVRVSKTIHAPAGIFSIGSGLNTANWTNMAFLMKSNTTGPEQTVALEYSSDMGVFRMDYATGLVADPRTPTSIIVVGSGTHTDLAGVVVAEGRPSIARICIAGCEWKVLVQVGNGDNLEGEWYWDVQTDARSPFTILVVGNKTIPGLPSAHAAILRIIDLKTLLPIPVGSSPTALYASYVAPVLNSQLQIRYPTSVVSSLALDMIVVGIILFDPNSLDGDGDCTTLWPLKLNGDPIGDTAGPLAVTGFNSPLTTCLRLPAGASGCRVIKLLADQHGTLFATCIGLALPISVTVPGHFVAVYAFNTDTDPLLSFGSNGIASWWDTASGSTRPNDALLNPQDSSVIVVGNTFASEVSGATDFIRIIPYACPWLSVLTPPPNALADFPAPPVPFLVKFGCAGLPCVLLHGLPECPCSSFLFAFSVVFTVGYGQVLILGDADTKPFGTSQPAGVLAVQVALSSHGARVLNCGVTPAPVISTSCSGVVTVDACCAPTALVVNGTVTVGDNADPAPLPGTIKFVMTPSDPVRGKFYGFDGDAWREFAFVSPP